MTIHNMKTTTFDKVTYAEWKEVAVKSLRGLPFDKLVTKTIEEIDLQPLYTNEGLEPNPTIRAAKTTADWIIAQPQMVADAATFVTALKSSLTRGNEAIVYDGKTPYKWCEDSLQTLSELLVSYPVYLTNISNDDQILQAFKLIPKDEWSQVKGTVEIEQPTQLKDFPKIRTIVADVRSAHFEGADAVSELAFVLAEAVELVGKCPSFEVFNEAFYVRFAIDTHFFMEIAKVRAFRVLWQALSFAYGIEHTEHVPVLSETSLRTYAKTDPYVNLLRAGNEAFSAVLGGTDVLTVHPHNILTGTTPTSLRLARNVQLVIKEETLVSQVLDPSGGSFFLEKLTNDLVGNAWTFFLEIEEMGGYSTYKKSGAYRQHLDLLYQKRLEDVATGVTSLVGTNTYADLSEDILVNVKEDDEFRLAKPFEAFRTQFKGAQPIIKLLVFGDLKDFKPRADFVGSYLSTGGLASDWSPVFTSAEDAVKWLDECSVDYAVICGTNEQVKAVLPTILKDTKSSLWIDVAGQYDDETTEQWKALGLNGFLYKGQNKLGKFTEIAGNWKGANGRA